MGVVVVAVEVVVVAVGQYNPIKASPLVASALRHSSAWWGEEEEEEVST